MHGNDRRQEKFWLILYLATEELMQEISALNAELGEVGREVSTIKGE